MITAAATNIMTGPKSHIPGPGIVSGTTFLLCVEPPNAWGQPHREAASAAANCYAYGRCIRG